MSIPTSTNFIANNSNYTSTDLINIFDKYSTIQPTPSTTTNYITGSYDLGQIFIPIPLGSGSTPDTGFLSVISGTTYDLAKVFQVSGATAAVPFSVLTGTYSYIYDYTNQKYYLTITSSGTFQYIADITGNIDLIVVGGGGGGGGATNGSTTTAAGGGGGGGGAIDVTGTMIASSGNFFVKNTTYTVTVGAGGAGSSSTGSAGATSKFSQGVTDYVTSTGGNGGGQGRKISGVIIQSGNAAQGTSTFSAGVGLSAAYSSTGGGGGLGGNTTVADNFTGTVGRSSLLSVNYYGSGSGTYYSSIANTFLIYNWMLFSGGGGGATDGDASDGYSSWGGYGLNEFAGGLYGYTSNTTQPISNAGVGWGENNNPPTTADFPTFSAVTGYAPGGGGSGVGYAISGRTGASGANGVIKTYFNYTPPTLTTYPSSIFSVTGNARYFLMNDSTDDYFIINCYSGSSTVTFTTGVACDIIAVGGGGGGGGGSGITSPKTSGAGGGGGAAATYTYSFPTGTYNITVGTGGSGGSGATSGSAGGTTTVVSGATTLISCTGGGGGVYSAPPSQTATGGTAGTTGGTLTPFAGGSGGAGGQGSENGADTTTSANQASYGITSDLTSTILPDNTTMFLAGGGAGGSCDYTGVVSINYGGGGAGHGYGGWVGASYTGSNASAPAQSVNGQNALCYGGGGGGGSSNSASTTSGGNGAPGIVLFYFKINPYTVSSLSNISLGTYYANGYQAVVFNNTLSIGSGTAGTGTATMTITKAITANILVVGGGGGGGGGNGLSVISGGCGGGGAGVCFITSVALSAGTTISISVGNGGWGRTPGNQAGGGSDAGSSGADSLISYSGITYTAGKGGGGLGSGTVSPPGGGSGGSATTSGGSTARTFGGGGGGGANYSDSDTRTGGTAGTGGVGNSGTAGSNASSTYQGGNGGAGGANAALIRNLTLDFLVNNKTVYLGGGGGGGSTSSSTTISGGGGAGLGTGGTAGVNSGTNPAGIAAVSGINDTVGGTNAFGGGGGGGGESNDRDKPNPGGNGGKGVVIVWWSV